MILRAVIYKQGPAWIAQGLEHDICVHSRHSRADAINQLEIVMQADADIDAQFGREPWGATSTPKRFYDMFDSGEFDTVRMRFVPPSNEKD